MLVFQLDQLYVIYVSKVKIYYPSSPSLPHLTCKCQIPRGLQYLKSCIRTGLDFSYTATSVIIQVLQCGGVGVDETEMVLQPAHLGGVPGLLELPQPSYLVHQLPLLRDPQSSEVGKFYCFVFRKQISIPFPVL